MTAMFDPDYYTRECLSRIEQVMNGGIDPNSRVSTDDFKKWALLHGAGSARHSSMQPVFVREMRNNTANFNSFTKQLMNQREAAILSERVKFVNDLSLRTTLQPSYSQQLEIQLHNLFDLSLREAGKVGLEMQEVAQAAKASIDYAGMLAVNNAVRNFTKTIDRLSQLNNLGNEKLTLTIVTTDYAGYDLIVPTTTAAQVAIEAKRRKFYDYLKSLGFSQADITDLTDAARQLYKGYEDLYIQAHALGLPVDDVRFENALQLHRVYTEGGRDVLNTLDTKDLIEDVAKDNLGLSSVLDANTGFFTYAVNDEVAWAVMTGLTPGDHLFMKGGTGRNVSIKVEPLGNPGTTTSYRVPKSQAGTLMYLNSNVTDSGVRSVSDFRRKAKTEVQKHYRREIAQNSNFNPTTVDVLNFLNVPAVRTSDDEIFVARQGYFGYDAGKFQKVNPTTLNNWEVNHGLVDAVARTDKGNISYSPVNRVNTLNNVLRDRVDSFIDTKNNTQIVVDDWLRLNNSDAAVITPGGNSSTLVTKTGFDTTKLATTTTFEWYAGRAEKLKDSAGNWTSQYIREDAKTYTRVNPNSDSVKQQLINDLLNDSSIAVSDPKVIARLRDKNISEIELRDIAQTHLQALGYEAWVYQNLRKGEYVVIPFSDNVLVDFNPANVDILLQDEIALLDYMLGTSYVDPATGNRVNNPGKITHGQLDQLVDSGVLSRLRMPSIDIINYLYGKYNLPFNSPAMMVSADLPNTMQRYVTALKDGAAVSAVVTTIVRDGVSMGWAVDASKPLVGAEYKAWTTLNERHLQLLQDLNWSQEMIDEISKYRFHPIVTELLAKQLLVASDPELLGYAAQVWKGMSDFLITGMMAGANNVPGFSYAEGNIITDIISSFANGGNVFTALPNIIDAIKTFASNSVVGLSTAPKYLHPETGAAISQRDAMEIFLKHYAQQAAAATTDVATGLLGGSAFKSMADNVGFGYLDSWSMLRWAWSQNIGVTAPAGKAAKLSLAALSALNRVARGLLTPAILATSMAQRGIMFNHFTSLLMPVNYNPAFATLRRISSLGFWQGYATNMNDMWTKMDRVFIYGDKAGTVTKGLHDTNLMNFAAYSMKTPVNVIRQMANNPIPYYNYLRLLQFNHELNYEREDINQLQVADYELTSNHSLLGSYTDSNGQLHGLALYNSYNPYSQTLNMANGFGRFLGIKPKTFEMYLKSTYMSDTELFTESLNNLVLSNAGNIAKMAIELGAGIDADTGLPFREGVADKKASFWGFDGLPNRVSSALGRVPFIGAFDRNNLQHIFGWQVRETPLFGKGTVREPWTGEVLEPGELGQFGNERFPIRNADRLKDAPQIVGIAREIGFDFKAISYNQNEVRSIKALDRAVEELSSQFSTIRNELYKVEREQTATSASNIQQLRDRASDITDSYLTLRFMQVQLDAYAYKEGRNPPRVQDKMDRAADQLYVRNSDGFLRDEVERLIDEAAQVYELIDNLPANNE